MGSNSKVKFNQLKNGSSCLVLFFCLSLREFSCKIENSLCKYVKINWIPAIFAWVKRCANKIDLNSRRIGNMTLAEEKQLQWWQQQPQQQHRYLHIDLLEINSIPHANISLELVNSSSTLRHLFVDFIAKKILKNKSISSNCTCTRSLPNCLQWFALCKYTKHIWLKCNEITWRGTWRFSNSHKL